MPEVLNSSGGLASEVSWEHGFLHSSPAKKGLCGGAGNSRQAWQQTLQQKPSLVLSQPRARKAASVHGCSEGECTRSTMASRLRSERELRQCW